MRIALGSDEMVPLVDHLRDELGRRGHTVVDASLGDAWPEVGHHVGEAVAEGQADLGVVCCWTGTGVSIAANKVAGVRAALCTDAATAEGARRWNDANVLALSLRLTSDALATEILDAFLSGAPDATEAEVISAVESGSR
jgi:ribose 5-phosphate isomerase B